jgi:TonB-linked SusC/RagA family outer membrane protein
MYFAFCTKLAAYCILLFAFCTCLYAQNDTPTDVVADSLLLEDNRTTSDRISMGYYAMPTAAITGAIETVSGAMLEKTPVANLGLSLAGRLNGLTTIELSGDLANSSVSKFIRGVSTANGTDPLVIIDGVICPTSNWDYLTAHEIESISILKDGSSTAIYGMQGAGGAIIITTKRGFEGKAKIEGYFDQSLQQNVRRPQFITSAQYVKMRNQAASNDSYTLEKINKGETVGLYTQFSESAVAGFEQGNNPLYPNNDWYSMAVNDWAQMQRAGLNILGGKESIKYFINLNYMHQSSPLKVTPNDKFDAVPAVNSVNFRSNIDLNLNRYLSGFLRLSGNVNLQKTPFSYTSNEAVYSTVFELPPTMYGPLTDDAPLFNAEGTLLEGSHQVVTTNAVDNPIYGILNRSGYDKQLQTSIVAQSGLTLDMGFLTKGLSLSALMAYQTYANSSTATVQTFKSYVRDLSQGYETLRFIQKLDDRSTDDVLTYGKYSQFMYSLNLFAHADYNRTFGDHGINAMAYVTSMTHDKEIPLDEVSVYGYTRTGAYILPYKRLDMGVTATYGYKNRYFLKGDLGYTGSDQFARDYRYIATPAVSVAWIASEEDFLKGHDILTYLKLRASYGVNANDQLGGFRFMYLDEYSSDGTEKAMGNPFVTAEKIKKRNYGIDLGLINDFTLHFDYYWAHTGNMLIDGAISMPVYGGIFSYPKLNEGEMENRGLEASLMYQKQLDKDFSLFAGTGLAYNKNKVISINEVPRGEGYKYQYRTEGFSVSQYWGYLIDYSNGNGYINTIEELEKATEMYIGAAPRLGDFMYQDISGDGKLDTKDYAPIGYGRIPEIYYNVNLGFEYKRFEFSVLLQGAARSSADINGLGVDEAYSLVPDGYFTDIHLNAWTPDNHNADFPALSNTTSISHQPNDFFIMNTDYLKLRNLEVAYTLPGKVSRLVAAEKIRIAFNAQNLFTFDHIRTKYIDPETANMSVFQPYRVLNVGIKATF